MWPCSGQWCVDWAAVLNVFVTLAAAFGGAWAAFGFERWQKRQDEDERRIGAANQALYTIFNLWNVQEQYRIESIEAYRGKPDAWLNMDAIPHSVYGVTTFDANALSFLLNGDATTYSEIFMEEQRSGLALGLMDKRSNLILDVVLPRLSAGGVGVGHTRAAPDFERILGIDVVHKLTRFTDGIIRNVDENLVSLMQTQDNLRAAMKRRYPNTKFIEFKSK